MSIKYQKIEQKQDIIEISSVAGALRSMQHINEREQILNGPSTKRISAQQFRDMRRAARLRERPSSDPGQ
jgi:hypothetical protein